MAPCFSSSETTWVLCTICLRTYTGAPYSSRAFSTAMTARSTPAQYPRGAASSTRLCPTTGVSLSLLRTPGSRGIPRPIEVGTAALVGVGRDDSVLKVTRLV